MDLTLLIVLAAVTALILLGIGLFFNLQRSSKLRVAENRGAHIAQRARDAPRRAQIARNRGVRMRANVQQNEDDPDSPHEVDTIDDKIGTKKRAKLEAKAEKKAQREAEEHIRQDKKKREQLAEEERRKTEEKRLAEEKHLEEEERKAREEKERKEYEDYLEMKKAFTVEEEGFEESDGSASQNLLQEFVNYVKSKKVVVIEDLAAHFKLKTQSAIDRIQDLQKDDILTGVIDDRGKFIYVSPEEMEAVATFIRQRGRISIVELAENSNRLISLTPTTLINEL